METFLIAITGNTGSGKSTLTQHILNQYSKYTVCLIEDRYCYDRSHIHPLETRLNHNFDDPTAIDYDYLYKNIFQLKRGENINAPIYCYQTASRSNQTEYIIAKPIIIIEGLFILLNEALSSLCDLKIYIDVDIEICIKRRLERDVNERGMPQWFTPSQVDYIRNGERHVSKSKLHSDLIIQNNENNLINPINSIKNKLDIFLNHFNNQHNGDTIYA